MESSTGHFRVCPPDEGIPHYVLEKIWACRCLQEIKKSDCASVAGDRWSGSGGAVIVWTWLRLCALVFNDAEMRHARCNGGSALGACTRHEIYPASEACCCLHAVHTSIRGRLRLLCTFHQTPIPTPTPSTSAYGTTSSGNYGISREEIFIDHSPAIPNSLCPLE